MFIINLIRKIFNKNDKGINHYLGWYREPNSIDTIQAYPIESRKSPIKSGKWIKKWIMSMSMNIKKNYESFLVGTMYTFFLAVLMSLGGFGIFSLFKSMTSNGKVDYCYIDEWDYVQEQPKNGSTVVSNSKFNEHLFVVFYLKGHRPYRTDRDIGRFLSTDDLVAFAKKINCPIEDKN